MQPCSHAVMYVFVSRFSLVLFLLFSFFFFFFLNFFLDCNILSQGAWRSHPSHANEAMDEDWKGSQTCEPVPAKSWGP